MTTLTSPNPPVQALENEISTQSYHTLVIEDLQSQRSIPLKAPTYSLGRDKNNSIQIHDLGASRHHLIFLRVPLPNQAYIYRVVDGDTHGRPSLNGMRVNDVSCRQKDLLPGDEIRVGKHTRITYQIHTTTEDAPDWSFNPTPQDYQDRQEEDLDPAGTMTTILAGRTSTKSGFGKMTISHGEFAK